MAQTRTFFFYSKRILATEVTLVGKPDTLSWRPQAAMRYSDAPRGFEDATLWVCLHGDRPIAFQKVESMLPDKDRGPLWGHCFVSATEELIEVRWDTGREWKATASGLTWKTLSDAPLPAESPRKRRLQCRRRRLTLHAQISAARLPDIYPFRGRS